MEQTHHCVVRHKTEIVPYSSSVTVYLRLGLSPAGLLKKGSWIFCIRSRLSRLELSVLCLHSLKLKKSNWPWNFSFRHQLLDTRCTSFSMMTSVSTDLSWISGFRILEMTQLEVKKEYLIYPGISAFSTNYWTSDTPVFLWRLVSAQLSADFMYDLPLLF